VDRIGRGSLYVDALTLSILGGIQPNKLKAYTSDAFQGGAGDDGLLQRLQVVAWPDGLSEYRDVDREPNEKARDRAFRVFEAIAGIDPLGVGATKNFAPNGISFMRFAPEAQDLFNPWRSKLERRLRSGELKDCPAFESHMAKYRSLMPSLALIFHLVNVADGGEPGPVSLEVAETAVAWCEFLEAHARKVYAPELLPDVSAAHAVAEKIKSGAVTDEMQVRELYRNGWSGLKSSDVVWSALKELERLGWLRVVTLRTHGAPSHVVVLHPELRGDKA
jgi:putative DNA primase/helicase